MNARSIATTVAVTLTVCLLLAATCVYSGLYDISAAGGRSGLLDVVRSTLTGQSVASHARGENPPVLDAAAVETGAEMFHATCVVCHGGPGLARGRIGEGLNPPALELSTDAAGRLSEAQIFWIARNGIRFTGMPAFDQSHSDAQLWAIAKFVKTMDGMAEAEYETIFRRIKAKNGGVLPGSEPQPAHDH